MPARALPLLAAAALPLLGGCASVVLPVASGAEAAGVAGAGAGAREGMSYAFSDKRIQTFTCPVDKVHAAALDSLRKMRLYIVQDTEKGHVRRIRAATKELKIAIGIFPVTLTVSKVSVSVKKGFFIQDPSLAAEILNQVSQALGERSDTVARD